MSEQVSPEYVQISTAAAMTLNYFPGKFNRGERLNALNLLVIYENGCVARCGYCGLSKSRDPDENSFIRVDWPTVKVDDIIERSKEHGKHLQRVCVSMITHHKAFEDMLVIMKKFHDNTDLLISGLIAPSLIKSPEGMQRIKDAGADMVGIALDAATPEIFDEMRGKGVNGPHKWDHYWKTLGWAVDSFGRGNVGIHLIVGLGETEEDNIRTIQRAEDMGVKGQMFSFYPEEGSTLKDWPQPKYGHYRRVQLARYIINEGLGRADDMKFNEKGQVVDFGIDVDPVIDQGEAFMTSGCAGHDGKVACNRPYGNERPSRPIRNYAFLPESNDIASIRKQLADYDGSFDLSADDVLE